MKPEDTAARLFGPRSGHKTSPDQDKALLPEKEAPRGLFSKYGGAKSVKKPLTCDPLCFFLSDNISDVLFIYQTSDIYIYISIGHIYIGCLIYISDVLFMYRMMYISDV